MVSSQSEKFNLFKAAVHDESDRIVAELFELLSIPSVSTLPEHHSDCIRCSKHVAELLRRAGFQHVEECSTEGLPIVYGDVIADPSLPTILIYGHYDVQPAEPLDLWISPAFAPEIRDGYIYARGASDDKGQIFCHIKAVELMLSKYGKLPVNIKIIIEGEEEISSPSFSAFLNEHREKLSADICLVSDTPMFSDDQPSVCTSLRGIVYFEITLTGAATDLHSGQNGGPAPNPIQGLAGIIAQLKDSQNRVTIPGFYDDVMVLEPEMKAVLGNLPMDNTRFASQIGAGGLMGESGYNVVEQLWYRPALDCNGIWGGFTGEGSKTVIPSEASAKISIRLVRNQDPEDIQKKFINYITDLTPAPFRLRIKPFSSGAPYGLDSDHPALIAALAAVTQSFGHPAIVQGEGGSIPIIRTFKDLLGIDTILMGFNCPDDRIHAPNERFKLERLLKGILASIHFIEGFSEINRK